MKIYTYHEELKFKNQHELLCLWKRSWQAHGFSPIVLCKTHCESHPYYHFFISELQKFSIEITQAPLNTYGLACWSRWLAYATQPDENFYVSDYDVINHNFNPLPLSNGLHLMDHACPCIASGSSQSFEKLCETIIHTISKNTLFYKETYKELCLVHFHDQDFFQITEKLDPNLIKMTRDRRTFLSTPIMTEFWRKPLVHYGSDLCSKYLQQFSKKLTPTTRVELITDSLRKTLVDANASNNIENGHVLENLLRSYVTEFGGNVYSE